MNVHVSAPHDDGELNLLLDGARHRVLDDTDWIRWARRELNAPDLFLYWHLIEETFVLASWVEKPRTCRELRLFKQPPWKSVDQHGTLESLRRRLRPPEEHEKEMKDDIRASIKAKERAIEERAHDRQQSAQFLKNKGLHDAAALLTAGGTPFSSHTEMGEEGEELKKRLSEQVKGKITG